MRSLQTTVFLRSLCSIFVRRTSLTFSLWFSQIHRNHSTGCVCKEKWMMKICKNKNHASRRKKKWIFGFKCHVSRPAIVWTAIELHHFAGFFLQSQTETRNLTQPQMKDPYFLDRSIGITRKRKRTTIKGLGIRLHNQPLYNVPYFSLSNSRTDSDQTLCRRSLHAKCPF